MRLLYLAKPNYGGWVTFTVNLAKLNNDNIIKLGKKTEFTTGRDKTRVPKYRDFGYGVKYRNYLLDDLIKENPKEDLMITAIDKKYHHYLDILPLERVSIVVHDPTEIKSQKNFLLSYLPKMKRVITIRKSVYNYLKQFNIENDFLVHPFIPNTINLNLVKKGAVAISRIDWDKHTEILLKTNQLLTNPNHQIEIYGDKNDRYVYNKLKEIDSMKVEDPDSCYRGRFPKNQNDLGKILLPKKFMVDLSRIKNDGGGTQYTFLEAINYQCCLVLNQDWVNIPDSIWKHNVNCLVVKNENDLKTILSNDPDCSHIIKNSKKIIDTIQNSNKLWLFN